MSSQDSESTRDAFVAILRRCADFLATLPAGEVDAVLNGRLELRLSVAAPRAEPRKKQAATLDAERLPEIAARLRSFDNRKDGERLLREVAPSKLALEKLARYLDVAVRREDRLEDVLRRIVEATIGFRLSSAAVQGRSAVRKREERDNTHSAQTKKE